MKYLKYLLAITTFSLLVFFIQSCDDDSKEEGCGETEVSYHNDDNSHNNGKDCMSCHKDGGGGEGCFIIAGSVYDSLQTTAQPNVTVRLYTEANGAGLLKYTIQGDKKGNFFTTDNVNYGGLYPAVTSLSGNTQYMPAPLTKGNCNSCHGVSTGKIWSR
jgi:hypothetical protein